MKKLMKNIDFDRLFPPGLERSRELTLFCWGYVLSLIFSLSYYIHLSDAVNQLYRYNGRVKYIPEGRLMPDFYTLIRSSFAGFWIVCIMMLVFAGLHYTYHRQGTKSIYLMLRLPKRWELHRRCLTMPLVGIGICLVSAFIVLLIFYASYMLATPEQCLVPGQWENLWSVIL